MGLSSAAMAKRRAPEEIMAYSGVAWRNKHLAAAAGVASSGVYGRNGRRARQKMAYAAESWLIRHGREKHHRLSVNGAGGGISLGDSSLAISAARQAINIWRVALLALSAKMAIALVCFHNNIVLGASLLEAGSRISTYHHLSRRSEMCHMAAAALREGGVAAFMKASGAVLAKPGKA